MFASSPLGRSKTSKRILVTRSSPSRPEAIGRATKTSTCSTASPAHGRKVALSGRPDPVPPHLHLRNAAHAPSSTWRQKAVLREIRQPAGGNADKFSSGWTQRQELYFDRCAQIRCMRGLSGRVALVGDSAFCVSLRPDRARRFPCRGLRACRRTRQAAHGGMKRLSRIMRRCCAHISTSSRKAQNDFWPRSRRNTRVGLFSTRNQSRQALSVPGLAQFIFGPGMLIVRWSFPNISGPCARNRRA